MRKLGFILFLPLLLTGCIENGTGGGNNSGYASEQKMASDAMQSSMIAPAKQHKWQSLSYEIEYVADKAQIEAKANYIKENCIPDYCYIASSNIAGEGNGFGRFTLKMIPERVAEFRKGLGASLEMVRENITVQDYSGEVVDIESRKALLREQIEQLSVLRDKTGDVKSLIEIADRIAQAQNDIEKLDGTFRVIENDTAFDTLNITFRNKIEEPSIWSPLLESIKAVPALIIQGLAALIYTLAAALPIGLMLWPLYLFWRRRQNRLTERKTPQKPSGN